jgi:hypothetical protein
VQRPSAPHTNAAMRAASWDRKPGGRPCPIPSIRTSSAPGIASAVARPPLTSHRRSARPWITRVGTLRCRRSSVRSPEANRSDRLASDADRIVGAVVGAACSLGDFILVRRISRRADGAESGSASASGLSGPRHLSMNNSSPFQAESQFDSRSEPGSRVGSTALRVFVATHVLIMDVPDKRRQ